MNYARDQSSARSCAMPASVLFLDSAGKTIVPLGARYRIIANNALVVVCVDNRMCPSLGQESYRK